MQEIMVMQYAFWQTRKYFRGKGNMGGTDLWFSSSLFEFFRKQVIYSESTAKYIAAFSHFRKTLWLYILCIPIFRSVLY